MNKLKNIVITGGNKGVGLSIVKKLLKENYSITIIARNLTEDLKFLIAHNKTKINFKKFDLVDIEKIPDLVKNIVKDTNDIYGLINNAGVGLDGLLATQHLSEINKIMAVNLHAPIYLTKYICRYMLKRKQGRIINISSIIANTGFSGLSVYAASKAGLEGFTRSLSRELGRANITVNSIAPGFMKTEMTSSLKGSKLDSIQRRSPLGLTTPDDVANLVAFILSEESNKITGSIYRVDGGSSA